jgi:hypothetical protein
LSKRGERYSSKRWGDASSKTGETRIGKGKKVANVGDLISVKPHIFDDETGSYSKKNPGLVFWYCEFHH